MPTVAHEATFSHNSRKGFARTDHYTLALPRLLEQIRPGLRDEHVQNYLHVIQTGAIWTAHRKTFASRQARFCPHCRKPNTRKHHLFHECPVFAEERATLVAHFQSAECNQGVPESLALFAVPTPLSSEFAGPFWRAYTDPTNARTAIGIVPTRWRDHRTYQNATLLFAAPKLSTASEAFRTSNGDDQWPRFPDVVPPPIATPLCDEEPAPARSPSRASLPNIIKMRVSEIFGKKC